MSDYKSQLDELQSTVETIDSVLRDAAEINQELLSHQEKRLIDELKDAVFEADDLLDEFVTLAHQKQLLKADGRVSEKVRSFFSFSNNPLSVAYRMRCGVKKIKKKLDAIAYNKQFSFKHDPQPIRNRRPDTCSYVNEVDIIGRKNELDEIVGMLLDPSNDIRGDMSFLSVVGIGGLGKTALAQLVFNDPRVTSAFSWRNWTCVADQDQKVLDVKQVLCKIIRQNHEGSYMEHVQTGIRNQLARKRYLLVLDDVWTENRNQWCDLVKYFVGGLRGSWIVVTTRSQKTATIVGGQIYELQGLSQKNSWRLFERTAFTPHQSLNPLDELVKIGQKIVDGCAGVPLAIRVAGTLLYGQDKGKWKSVQEMGLANIRESENGILPVLKLSFYHLEYPLKSCFGYCAVFPKDFEMEKEMLKSLWMAQGYIVPLEKGQSMEDACEEYFSILLRRCFFQDIKENNFGEVFSCKMHDLMHDICLDVSGKEIFNATDTIKGSLDKNICHLSLREHGNHSLLGKTHIRSHLHVDSSIEDYIQFPVEALVANCRCLRALDLHMLRIKSLPSCIGELLHLRYLDLSYNGDLQVLPKSLSKLYNLQTFKIRGCMSLRELPKDLSRLVKLRLLDVWGCDNLTYMPKCMGKLSCLHWLSDFKVGGGGSSSSWKQLFDSLEDLKALNKLKGSLNIEIRWPKKDKKVVKEDDDEREGLYMKDKEHLNMLSVKFKHEEGDDGGKDEELRLMEDLQPHSNLRHLFVANYNGVKMPGWLTLVQNIISLELYDCGNLEYLPCMEKLRHLKYLGIINLPKLKGWKKGVVGRVEDNNIENNQSLQLLACLSKFQDLSIENYTELKRVAPASFFTSTSRDLNHPQFRYFNVDNVAWPNSLPFEYVHCVNTLFIRMDNEEYFDYFHLPNWMHFLPRLEVLNIYGCRALKAIPMWFQTLTSITRLELGGCSESLKKRCLPHTGDDWFYLQHIPRIIFYDYFKSS